MLVIMIVRKKKVRKRAWVANKEEKNRVVIVESVAVNLDPFSISTLTMVTLTDVKAPGSDSNKRHHSPPPSSLRPRPFPHAHDPFLYLLVSLAFCTPLRPLLARPRPFSHAHDPFRCLLDWTF